MGGSQSKHREGLPSDADEVRLAFLHFAADTYGVDPATAAHNAALTHAHHATAEGNDVHPRRHPTKYRDRSTAVKRWAIDEDNEAFLFGGRDAFISELAKHDATPMSFCSTDDEEALDARLAQQRKLWVEAEFASAKQRQMLEHKVSASSGVVLNPGRRSLFQTPAQHRERVLALVIPHTVVFRDVALHIARFINGAAAPIPTPSHQGSKVSAELETAGKSSRGSDGSQRFRHWEPALDCTPWVATLDPRCVLMHDRLRVECPAHAAVAMWCGVDVSRYAHTEGRDASLQDDASSASSILMDDAQLLLIFEPLLNGDVNQSLTWRDVPENLVGELTAGRADGGTLAETIHRAGSNGHLAPALALYRGGDRSSRLRRIASIAHRHDAASPHTRGPQPKGPALSGIRVLASTSALADWSLCAHRYAHTANAAEKNESRGPIRPLPRKADERRHRNPLLEETGPISSYVENLVAIMTCLAERYGPMSPAVRLYLEFGGERLANLFTHEAMYARDDINAALASELAPRETELCQAADKLMRHRWALLPNTSLNFTEEVLWPVCNAACACDNIEFSVVAAAHTLSTLEDRVALLVSVEYTAVTFRDSMDMFHCPPDASELSEMEDRFRMFGALGLSVVCEGSATENTGSADASLSGSRASGSVEHSKQAPPAKPRTPSFTLGRTDLWRRTRQARGGCGDVCAVARSQGRPDHLDLYAIVAQSMAAVSMTSQGTLRLSDSAQ